MHGLTRRWITAAAAAGFLAGTWACKTRPPQVETIEEGDLPPLSVIQVAHPRAAAQLLSGFHKVEHGAWRWTKGKFAVLLMPPPGAAQKGAELELRFTLPEPVVSRRHSVTLSASVQSTALAPETYSQAGNYTFRRDVPVAALASGEPVTITFTLDKFLRANEVEPRELGLVALSVGLVPK
jgi:hypothetical protein